MRLAIHNLDKRLGAREVLRGVSLSMQAAEVLVILGPNGSGKSTLLRLVAGIWEPDGGRIEVDGNPLSDGGLPARRLLGYVPDSADPLPDLLVTELISLVCRLKQAPLPTPALIDQLGVTPYLAQRLGSLSFGQRKRACLLVALIGNPVLLLLDEPSNGLDPEGVSMVIELIKRRQQEGLATLLATNDKPFAAALPARCLRIAAGQLTAATP
jgi:ABC-type multidrug transport system ATPase subunit